MGDINLRGTERMKKKRVNIDYLMISKYSK